jgi:60 kDa SS-A/Ro ribonucleoprotein
MARFNLKTMFIKPKTVANRAGGEAYAQSPEMALASLLLTSFVQDQFYRSAAEQMKELEALMARVQPEFSAKAAIYARTEYGMRSITHVLAAHLAAQASGKVWAKQFYNRVVFRPDDMLEIAALTKAKGAKMLPNAMKKGFAEAFNRFDGYQLAKYRGEGRSFKLVDLVNLVHPIPNERNAEALRQLVADTLRNTATWEAKLTAAGKQATDETEKMELKSAAWAELIQSNKLGYLAMLRNLRNIGEQAPEYAAEVAKRLKNEQQIRKALVMPFQYLIALDALNAGAAFPVKRVLQEALTDALEISLANVPRFEGRTLVVVDDSGSMSARVGAKGFASRSCIQLGATFAAALFKSNDADLMRFSDDASYVRANSRDSLMTIAENIVRNARAAGTNFHAIFQVARERYDRIVILSDMQGWVGNNTPAKEFEAYKRRTGANPFVYSFDLAGYGSLQLPEDRVFCLAGFSEKVFDLMKMLETDRRALVSAIEAVSL